MKWLVIILVVIVGFLLWQSTASAADAPKVGDPAPEFGQEVIEDLQKLKGK